MTAAPPRPDIPRVADLDLVIHTARLTLRPFADTDVDAIWPFVSDPEFPRLMSWAAHQTREETAGFIAYAQQTIAASTGIVWAIDLAGTAIGCISFDSIGWRMRAWRIDRTELGYWLAPAHWNQGYMTEAAQAAMRFGFETLGLNKIKIGCHEQNIGSRRVIEHCGFRYIGRHESDVWRDGAWHSQLRYELCRHEWNR